MDHVVRFNRPPSENQYAGMRTDQLVLANTTSGTVRLLQDPHYLASPVWQQARALLLPMPINIVLRYMPPVSLLRRLIGKSQSKSRAISRIAHAAGKPVTTMDDSIYLATCAALGLSGYHVPQNVPSSGIMAVTHFLRDPNASLTLFGFGFAGIALHHWEAERRWVEHLVKAGRITYAR